MSESIAVSHVKHCVLMKFQPATSEDMKASIFSMLEGLRKKPLGILEMVHGPFLPSPGPSTPLNRDYTDGLVVTFATVEDRNHYNDDPDHQRILTENILPNLVGQKDGLLRFDFLEG